MKISKEIEENMKDKFNIGCDSELELGYRIKESYRGKGLMTKFVNAVCEWTFEKLNIERIVALIHSENLPSQKVLEKNNF